MLFLFYPGNNIFIKVKVNIKNITDTRIVGTVLNVVYLKKLKTVLKVQTTSLNNTIVCSFCINTLRDHISP